MTSAPKPNPLKILFNPFGVIVLIAACLVAFMASMPLILLPGVMAYGILAYLEYQRAASAAVSKETMAPVSPDTTDLQKPYAARVQRIVAVQKAILQEIESAAEEHQSLLAGNGERVKHLVLAGAKLTRQLQEIDRHLSSTSPHDLERETRSLEQRVASAHDPVAKEGYEKGLAQQKHKAKAYEDLAARRERLDAQLVNVEQALETVSTQIIRIKSTDTQAANAEGVRIAESLDSLTVDVDAVAETVDETAAGYRKMSS